MSGFVHGKAQLSCPDCLADDRKGRRSIGCETCGGSGYVVETRRDPYMTNDVRLYGLDGAQHDRHVALGEAVRTAAREARRFGVDRPASELDQVAEANERAYSGLTPARSVMYEQFDYRALDVAIDELHKTHPGVSARSEFGLTFIDARMPDPIRAPRAALGPLQPVQVTMTPADVERAERAERIRALALAGCKAHEIAVEVKCSLATVYRVVKDIEAAA